MPNLVDTPKTPNVDDHNTKETAARERLDRSAEDVAEQGEKTEQRYDENHDLFTK